VYLEERNEIIAGHKDGKITVLSLKNFNGPICNIFSIIKIFINVFQDAFRGHENDVTVMIKLNEANRFLSASKDKSMKLWRLPGSYSKDPNLQGNSIDNSGDDLQGTEYYYKDVDQLKEEDSEDQLNRRKSSYSGSSRSENSNQTSSDSEVDYRNI
jgi:hypothetical protein